MRRFLKKIFPSPSSIEFDEIMVTVVLTVFWICAFILITGCVLSFTDLSNK